MVRRVAVRQEPSLVTGWFNGLAALVLFVGCAAPRESLNEPRIGPAFESGRGYLTVEEADPSIFTSRGGSLRLAPFVLYDPSGKYVARSADAYPHIPPLTLVSGRYTVVAWVRGEERRIPVLIAEGRLTRVNLDALDQEPEWKKLPVEPEVRP